MGWFIICVIVTTTSILVLRQTSGDFLDDHVVTNVIASITAVCFFCAAWVLGIQLVCSRTDQKAYIDDYNRFRTSIENIMVPSDAVAEKVLKFNEHITKARAYEDSWLTKGLYGKEVAGLELIPLPEPFNVYHVAELYE